MRPHFDEKNNRLNEEKGLKMRVSL